MWKAKRNNKKGTLVKGARPDDIGEDLYVFEGLSATGLRSIRYVKEVNH